MYVSDNTAAATLPDHVFTPKTSKNSVVGKFTYYRDYVLIQPPHEITFSLLKLLNKWKRSKDYKN